MPSPAAGTTVSPYAEAAIAAARRGDAPGVVTAVRASRSAPPPAAEEQAPPLLECLSRLLEALPTPPLCQSALSAYGAAGLVEELVAVARECCTRDLDASQACLGRFATGVSALTMLCMLLGCAFHAVGTPAHEPNVARAHAAGIVPVVLSALRAGGNEYNEHSADCTGRRSRRWRCSLQRTRGAGGRCLASTAPQPHCCAC